MSTGTCQRYADRFLYPAVRNTLVLRTATRMHYAEPSSVQAPGGKLKASSCDQRSLAEAMPRGLSLSQLMSTVTTPSAEIGSCPSSALGIRMTAAAVHW